MTQITTDNLLDSRVRGNDVGAGRKLINVCEFCWDQQIIEDALPGGPLDFMAQKAQQEFRQGKTRLVLLHTIHFDQDLSSISHQEKCY